MILIFIFIISSALLLYLHLSSASDIKFAAFNVFAFAVSPFRSVTLFFVDIVCSENKNKNS